MYQFQENRKFDVVTPLNPKFPCYGTFPFYLYQLHHANWQKIESFENSQIGLQFGLQHLWNKVQKCCMENLSALTVSYLLSPNKLEKWHFVLIFAISCDLIPKVGTFKSKLIMFPHEFFLSRSKDDVTQFQPYLTIFKGPNFLLKICMIKMKQAK